jgi:hypothetical protein
LQQDRRDLFGTYEKFLEIEGVPVGGDFRFQFAVQKVHGGFLPVYPACGSILAWLHCCGPSASKAFRLRKPLQAIRNTLLLLRAIGRAEPLDCREYWKVNWRILPPAVATMNDLTFLRLS